jgi:altronate hydrolase
MLDGDWSSDVCSSDLVDAGAMLSAGVGLEDKGREIYELMLRVASGEPSKSEAEGLGDFEFVPWQIGATM